MIATISGRLTHKSPEFIIVDVHGIGYRIIVPLSTYYKLPDPETAHETSSGQGSGQVFLHTYTHVREDAFLLFGFLTKEEKDIFGKLIGVSQIGPKLAVNILSGISAVELKNAIARGDIIRLTSIPGVGKKTAERIILELKDKIEFAIEDSQPSSVSPHHFKKRDNLFEDAVSALVNLGYKKGMAEDAVKQVRGSPGEKHGSSEREEADIEDLIRGALKILSKS
ncbi:MAG: Holliday junction branch migration protein RuvA [Nitrospinae bacterium]|nr:Holliday junction branch migration protein RuvA [Nitrospinota bacterium]